MFVGSDGTEDSSGDMELVITHGEKAGRIKQGE